jgi:hypothetical protein
MQQGVALCWSVCDHMYGEHRAQGALLQGGNGGADM